ncbi:flagellar hook-associated protein FlgL [Terrilactibacillus sp. S3-3]|nr:flagellar hook-associated protein FlgL [Terrilactibacillus sp. S3-3]
MMRVTQNMMTNNILQQLSSGYGKIAEYQELSSGKKITRPSQDPVVAVMSVSYQTDVNHIQQYQSNISTAYNWLDSSESVLSSVNDVLNRVRDLTEEVSNGTYDDTQRAAAGTEIDQLTQQLMTLGNTQVGGQYIFNGDDTQNAPITQGTNGDYSVSDNSKSVLMAVNDGISIAVNVSPTKVFSAGLFSDLNDLKNIE